MRRFIAQGLGDFSKTIGFHCLLQAGRFRIWKRSPSLDKPGLNVLKIQFNGEFNLQAIETW